MIITDREQRKDKLDSAHNTDPMESILGSICRSFGYKNTDLQTLTGNANMSSVLTTQWRTPSYALKQFRPLCTLFAITAAKYAEDDIPAEYPDWPGCSITARAIILAAARSYDEAVNVYEDMKSVHPEEWDQSEERRNILAPFRQIVLKYLPLVDHRTIEGAVCKLIGITGNNITDRSKNARNKGGISPSTAKKMVNGQEDWQEKHIEKHFLSILKETSEWLQRAVPLEEPDESHEEAIASLTPSQTAVIWQLWPRLRQTVQEQSQWIAVRYDNLGQEDGETAASNT